MTDIDRFKNLINADIRGTASTEEQQTLHDDLDLWRSCLLEMKRNSEFQLASSRAESHEKRLELDEDAWQEYEADRLRWKANTIRFKNGVENKLEYIKRLEREDLAYAIAEHRENVLAAGPEDDTVEFDERLWSKV